MLHLFLFSNILPVADMSLKRLSTGQGDETESRKKVCTPVSRCSEQPHTSENGGYENGFESLKEGMCIFLSFEV